MGSGLAVIKSPLEIRLSTRTLNTRWSKMRTFSQSHRGNKNIPVRLASSWKFEDTAVSKMHVSHEKSHRWSLLERETIRSTQLLVHSYVALGMTQTSVTETEEATFGKGRTLHFAEADTEWYTEETAHSISGDAAEIDVTRSFDLDEAVWWCGVRDPSIPQPDVMDWYENWSNYESSPCAENGFP